MEGISTENQQNIEILFNAKGILHEFIIDNNLLQKSVTELVDESNDFMQEIPELLPLAATVIVNGINVKEIKIDHFGLTNEVTNVFY